MTLSPIRSRESARKNFFMNSTYFMSKRFERFWAQEAEMTLTPISSR